MISEFVLSKVADFAYKELRLFIKKMGGSKLVSKKIDFENALTSHINSVLSWSSDISFKDLKKNKSLKETYTDLNIYLTPKKQQYFVEEGNIKLPIDQIFCHGNDHIVLLGQPGAGKTTSVKKISHEIISNPSFNENYFQFPLVVKISELSEPVGYSIFDKLYSIFNLELKFDSIIEKYKTIRVQSIIEDSIIAVLNTVNILILIDGIDEIPDALEKEKVLKEVKKLALSLKSSKMLITCRSGDYSISIENTSVFEICPLDHKQILNFSERWFGDPEIANKFLAQVNQTAYVDTLSRPLFIALLCSIYERVGRIPDKPKTVYKKLIALLLEEWDEQRMVKRQTMYASLDIDRKFDFLSQLAFYLTTECNTLVFDGEILQTFYKTVCLKYELPRGEALQVIEELESHHGIFIQDGYKRFKFYHKSMQEYLTAEFIRGFPSLPNNFGYFKNLPNEMAIAVSLSSTSTEYLVDLIIHVFKSELDGDFVVPFASRLFIERPSFEPKGLLALAFLCIYNTILPDLKENMSASNAINYFLGTKEFNYSLQLLLSDPKWKIDRSDDEYNVVTYTGYSNDDEMSIFRNINFMINKIYSV